MSVSLREIPAHRRIAGDLRHVDDEITAAETALSDPDSSRLFEARKRLYLWMRWHWGNHLHQGQRNFIGAMMDRADGELPGMDISVPNELTVEIEAVEKAVAEMRGSPNERYRELIVAIYRDGIYPHEIAGAYSVCLKSNREWSPAYTRQMINRAELICWRLIQNIEESLKNPLTGEN